MQDRPDIVAAYLGDRQTQRRQGPGRAGHQNGAAAKLLGQSAGMQATGPTERHQRELPGIETTLDADHPQRPDHLRVRDPHHAERRLQGVQAEPVTEPGERTLGEVAAQHQSPTQPHTLR